MVSDIIVGLKAHISEILNTMGIGVCGFAMFSDTSLMKMPCLWEFEFVFNTNSNSHKHGIFTVVADHKNLEHFEH